MSSQHLVFSFLEFLSSELGSRSEDERESLEVVMECLERVYKVSLTNPADVSRFHTEKPLTEIFESTATNQTSARQFPTDEDREEAEEFKTQGNNLMKDGKFEDAIECYDKAVKLDWTNAVYLCNRAAAYSKLGHHEEAVKNCKQSLELDPNYGKAYGRMGTAYMALEKYQEARDSFAKAKELDPGNVLYLNNLETAEERLQQAKERSSSQGMAGQPSNFMNSLFSNPGIMNMASQFMANPQMQQMMTNMMSGFPGMTTGDDQPGQQPTSQPAGQQPTSQPAGGQPDSADTTTPESNPGSEGTNPAPAAGAGGYTNIFQFATQMAEQLQQSNPELVNNLRQSMQNIRRDNTGQSDDAEDPNKNGKE
ncbi:small glutamine-rich tetratricopeptide repeat-containing protein beta-like [Dendronephthya gigantea]|uniref:small glutamine-rich tetratricopeptide repeat-containing protein beta-like n=1 Tax=Dendronephthya gigantea TaxID=151771 RepID=UPI001069F87E|nr:small glutamine-rich tetratricopeptide repeat-containing protein beta-like [Dendronephthya gigantea]